MISHSFPSMPCSIPYVAVVWSEIQDMLRIFNGIFNIFINGNWIYGFSCQLSHLFYAYVVDV